MKALPNTVKQPEVPRKRSSLIMRKDNNLSSSMKAKRKLSCVETFKCMVYASLVTHAHMPTVSTSFRRKPIYQATLWLSYALNSIKMASALMVKDANSYTASTTDNQNLHTLKLLRKEPDLLTWEMSKSVMTQEPNAYGPTLRLEMDVVHQRSQDLLSLKKSIIKRTITISKMKRLPYHHKYNNYLQLKLSIQSKIKM